MGTPQYMPEYPPGIAPMVSRGYLRGIRVVSGGYVRGIWGYPGGPPVGFCLVAWSGQWRDGVLRPPGDSLLPFKPQGTLREQSVLEE